MTTTPEAPADVAALIARAEGCLNSRNSAYPSDVLRECIVALRRSSAETAEAVSACRMVRDQWSGGGVTKAQAFNAVMTVLGTTNAEYFDPALRQARSRAEAAEARLAEWIAYADKLEGVLEFVAGESKDRLKVLQAQALPPRPVLLGRERAR